jgi:NAD(P)-dependent dehydrogenase (short-subunit alcohol dehydrogenase family)
VIRCRATACATVCPELAAAVVFLAILAADYITGTTSILDGGLTAARA